MIGRLLITFLIGTCLFAEGKRLSFDDVQGKSPFKYARLGMMVWFPNENSFLTWGKDEFKGDIVKVSFPERDTVEFVDSAAFYVKGKKLKVSRFSFDKSGKKLLLLSDRKRIWRHSYYGTFHVLDIQSNNIQPVSQQNSELRNVKFSPDGNKIAYVRKDNNLYSYDLDNNREKQLTSNGSDVVSNGHFGWVYEEEFGSFDAYRWSPDSRYIAYWEENQSKVPVFTLIDELELYPVTQKIHYPKAGQTNPEMNIFIADTKWRRRNIQLDIGETPDSYFPWMAWTSEKKLTIMRMNRLQKVWTFLTVAAKSGESVSGLTETDLDGWVDLRRDYHFLENGNILWISERSGWNHIYIHAPNGDLIKQVTDGDWEAKSIVHVDEASETIYFMANKESVFESRFYSIGFDGSDLKLLTKGKGSHRITVLPDGKQFIDSYSSTITPTKHILRNMVGKKIKILGETDKSQFEKYDWSYPEIIHFKSTDGEATLDGIITYPPDYVKGNRYPVIVYGYGMPGTQIVSNRWSGTWNQYLAQQGFIVFSLDARGMSGRGEAFKNLSYGNMAKYLARDTAAGVRYLVDQGIADTDRIGAWGWSGGGYFTGLMLTKNADLFDVGVAVAPVMDFRLYDSIYTERSMGLPQDNAAGYDSTSVYSYVDRFKGKLLVIHGTGDDNVHSQNTTQLIEAFVKHDKQLDIFIYPNRPHSMAGGNARKNLYKKMVTYFKDNLLGKPLVERKN
ncbi:MAG: S9 family peptidase [Candidatus Marinimicrobia bacterium]|nr:S9 family peptidase [Candidatus Neomarinimicrobiota bacterium]MBL7010474.1 S9 family peptidase [Candidatus Neomarinimicrobiota bacterium]MBL7030967.1 S9 family peptidase [Candidatus Neomarinimicrobiota bacterium]